jgi:transcription antitermination factor NusG
VYTHPLIPGRVFAEVPCETARHFAETIPELQRWVRPVRHRDLRQLPLTKTAPISSQLSMQTENAILKNGDRVKILGGDFRDIIGIVKEVCEHEYVVHLPSQDLDETFQRQLVRAAFRPGDEVKVLDGPHTGLTGWVVDVREDGISLMNMQKNMEVRECVYHTLLPSDAEPDRRFEHPSRFL